jgi:hypothetical protein
LSTCTPYWRGRWVSSHHRVSDRRVPDERLFSNLHLVGNIGNGLITFHNPAGMLPATSRNFSGLYLGFVPRKVVPLTLSGSCLLVVCGFLLPEDSEASEKGINAKFNSPS